MIAAIFDCMVFLQAATNDQGPAFACLSFVEASHVRLYLSPAILAEVQDVLTRPSIQIQFPHLTSERVDLFLLKLATLAVVLNDVADAGFPLRDRKDLPYLNLALAANAGYLVSWDNGLRNLMKNQRFQGKYSQLTVVDPVSFLRAVRETHPS